MIRMTKHGESGKEIAATSIGGLAASIATGLAAGLPAVWPVLVPVLLGAAAVEVSKRIMDDRSARADKFVASAESSSGSSFEDLLLAAAADHRLRGLLTNTLRAVVETPNEWLIDRLAEIYVHGVNDTDRIDELLLILNSLNQLGPLHIRLIRLLAQEGPYLGATNVSGLNVWPVDHIESRDREIAPMLDVLTGRLEMLGMVRRIELRSITPKIGFGLTAFGHACTDDLRRRARGM